MKVLITALVAALLVVLTTTELRAQKACDQFRTNITTGAMGVTERVPGVAGKRIYICGYMIMRSSAGQDLEFELSSGTGVNCATNKATIIPRMDVPVSGIVNRNPFVGEFTGVGHSICLQTFGNGSVTSIFYWAQF